MLGWAQMRGRALWGVVWALVAAASPARAQPATVPSELRAAPAWRAAAPISNLIYLNRCASGCTFTRGVDDSRSQTSSIPPDGIELSPFAHSEALWDRVVQCVRNVYAPYAVEIVTEDPGDRPHHEAIVAGHPREMGLSDDIGGVAVISADCSPRDNVISFTFANRFPSSVPLEICATVAQESAHSFGLDHVFDCTDPMTYLQGCGQKFFRDALLPCGEASVRPCRCGNERQNAHQTLLRVFGRGAGAAPPAVEILLPAPDDAVMAGYPIYASAIDPRGIATVDVLINNRRYARLPGHERPRDPTDPYVFVTPALPDGVQRIEVRARNDLGLMTSARVEATKGAPCTSAASCAEGQSCDAGACLWPPLQELGAACSDDADCDSFLCPDNAGERLCSQFCVPAVEGECPDGFECLAASDRGVCWPLPEPGGCCRASRSSGGQELLLLGVVLLLRRRKSGRARP